MMMILFILVLQKSREGSAALILSGQRSDASEMKILQEQTGEGISLAVHFFKVARNIFTLDFGNTIGGKSVVHSIAESFVFTIILASFAGVLAFLYGTGLGIYGHYNPSARKALEKINYIMMAVPVFIVALALLWIFSLSLQWFFPGGVDSGMWFVLPGIALGLKSGSHIYVFTDEFMRRELEKQYVRTATAFGYKKNKIFSKYIFKNMFLPLFSFWLLELGSYLSGAAIVEMVYSIPGIGYLLLRALLRYDINLLVGILVFVAAIMFIITLIQEYIDQVYAGYQGLQDER